MRPDPLLLVDDLSTTFTTSSDQIIAVDGVSFELARGSTLGIVGESGSGKSMLARSVLQLVTARNATTTGEVVLDGRPLSSYNTRQLRDVWGAEASMIFQDPMTALNATMRIGKQITEALREHLELDHAARQQRAVELLASVGIPDPEHHLRSYPHQLSGGMRQRAMIAIAIACGPKLLIADEPTTALDVTLQQQVLELLRSQQRQHDMAVILISHDLGVVAGRSDQIMVMYGGRVVEFAPTDRLFVAPRHPYTNSLLRSVPRLSDPPGTELAAVPGQPPTITGRHAGCNFAPRCPRAQRRCHVETPILRSEREDAPVVPGADATQSGFACFYPIEGATGAAADLTASTSQANPPARPNPTT